MGLAGLGLWFGGHDFIVRFSGLIDCKPWEKYLG